MPPPSQAACGWPTVSTSSDTARSSSAVALADPAITPLGPPTTKVDFAARETRARGSAPSSAVESLSLVPKMYMHLEIFDVDAMGVPVSSVRTLYTSTTVADRSEEAMVPSATHVHPSLFNARGVPVSTARAFATRTISSAVVTKPTSPHSKAADMDVLPDVPRWAVGLMAGCFAFIIFAAAALFLAQFKLQLYWTIGIGRWIKGKGRGSGYRKLDEDDYELDNVYCSDRQEACSARNELPSALKNRKAHTKHLSINTRQQYAGLGIAVQGNRNVESAEPQRRSNEELHSFAHITAVKVARRGSETAPLPLMKRFSPPQLAARRPSSAYKASADLEDGRERLSKESTSTPEIFDYNSPIHKIVQAPQRSASVLFDVINDGVASAADKMAKRFYDHINPMNEPEEGLLLHVRDTERERKGLNRVFVG